MEKVIINEDTIKGNPSRILSYLEVDLANNLLKGVNDDVILTMKQLIDVFETLYDRINDDYISFKWNPMGSWHLDLFDIYSKTIIQDGLLQLENDSNNADYPTKTYPTLHNCYYYIDPEGHAVYPYLLSVTIAQYTPFE